MALIRRIPGIPAHQLLTPVVWCLAADVLAAAAQFHPDSKHWRRACVPSRS